MYVHSMCSMRNKKNKTDLFLRNSYFQRFQGRTTQYFSSYDSFGFSVLFVIYVTPSFHL